MLNGMPNQRTLLVSPAPSRMPSASVSHETNLARMPNLRIEDRLFQNDGIVRKPSTKGFTSPVKHCEMIRPSVVDAGKLNFKVCSIPLMSPAPICLLIRLLAATMMPANIGHDMPSNAGSMPSAALTGSPSGDMDVFSKTQYTAAYENIPVRLGIRLSSSV